jgi:bacterioferritin
MLRRKWSIIAVRSQRKVQVTLYFEGLKHYEKVGDYVSRVPFDERIIDEEGQIDFLETQIGLFDRLGEERYGLLNAKLADQAE